MRFQSAARRFLSLALLTLACAASAQAAWPSKPVHLIVPFPPGSSPDLIARVLGEKLSPVLAQPVIVDNRPGAGGNIGTALVAKATPDGYTLGLSIAGPLAVNTVLYKRLGYDPFRDLAPVTLIGESPNLLLVDPNLRIDAVKDLVALAKSQPGKFNYGSVGNGSASHLTMELFKETAGIDILHIPYAGAPQVATALMNGQIAAGLVVPAVAMPLVRAGRLKALAVTSASRSALLPDYPSFGEAGYPEVVATAWNAMVAPAGTPAEIIARLIRRRRKRRRPLPWPS